MVTQKSLTDWLQKLQNRAARILTYTRKYDHISPILKSLHWLPVEKRIIFKVLVITFKALHGLAPSYLSELLHWYTPDAYELRSSTQHLLRRSSYVAKQVGFRRFEFAAPFLWNDLPIDLRKSKDIDAFKRALKTHLFNWEHLRHLLWYMGFTALLSNCLSNQTTENGADYKIVIHHHQCRST